MRNSSEPLLPTMAKPNGDGPKRKRVLVVGAGAAGMSCAYQLSAHPDKFDVTLVDTNDFCGGQAFSIPIDKEKFGASWLNQGVQGGSPIFHHTMTMFARQGFYADPLKLQVSFGKDDTFWTNVFPTKLLATHQNEVRRFVRMLSIVRTFELFFALLPIRLLLKLFWFSDIFANSVALPMIALFLGTGNYSTEVPSMIMERLSTSPTYGMWYPPDKLSIASNMPPMVVFPEFSRFYDAWRKDLEKRGVHVRLSTAVTKVLSRGKDGVVVTTKKAKGERQDVDGTAERDDDVETEERYDELVLCVLADSAKQILSHTASLPERRILGACKFADDITVTHCDTAYMKKHYEVAYNPEQAVSSLSGVDQSSRIEEAKNNFNPMYLIKTYPTDRSKLEMCFDCSNYQGQFSRDLPFDKHIFQTIFLNNDRDRKHWDLDEIDESKIIQKDWWHQLCHSWTHYAFVVPWLWLIQGRNHTRFASAWTLVNAHETAVISGVAAAVSLGATYPEDLERDKFAFLCFRLYYLFQYRTWYRRNATKKSPEGEGKDWASGPYGSFYLGPGAVKEEGTMHTQEKEAGRST
ncbi:FAD/NAD(P)-binding domain-containing protein [Tothia fuscella]|uniref:FAD/NAD(P)-binding domain-containing protein n=1 Tax=Tothia fuscella TaxID=1048955 RepID=A0A9P4NHV6_9PEZI|nr:FAD/NAD(P)-binding domain-containing protein [Tothia fuscella]